MEYQEIRYEVDGSLLTLTLHRPEKLNAFTERMMRELIDAFDRADADDSVRVIIVTGAGRAFFAGADLSAGSGTFDECGSKTQRFGTKTATRYPSIRTRLGSPNCRAWPGSTSRDKSCHCTIQRQKAVDDIFVFCRFADPREILKFCNDLKFRYQLAETSSQGKEGSLL